MILILACCDIELLESPLHFCFIAREARGYFENVTVINILPVAVIKSRIL